MKIITHLSQNQYRIPARLILSCFALWLWSANAHSNNLNISADIAPIHSLVSLVAGDQQTIDLIIPTHLSPHHFALKPSQVRALSQAHLVVIVSDSFSPSLSRHLHVLNANQVVLDLSSVLRTGKAHNANGHEQIDTHSTTDEKPPLDGHLSHDEHTWLNPLNAIEWLEYIAEALATLDEPNRSQYQANAMAAIADLSQMHQSLTDQLSRVSSAQYIVYHDAYRHFAHAFNLADPQPIALSDARAPGAAKLKQMREAAQGAGCVFSELQHDDAIVDTVSAGLGLKRGILDPIGSDIPAGPTLYAELLRTLAHSFSECLAN